MVHLGPVFALQHYVLVVLSSPPPPPPPLPTSLWDLPER